MILNDVNLYETQSYLNEYLFFHYGKPKNFCPHPLAPKEALNFQQRIVAQCVLPLRFKGLTRGLDIGCAVGRSTFELARVVDEVTGIDYSKNFIRAANQIARKHSIQIRVKEEGDRHSRQTVFLSPSLRRGNASFHVGDARDLRCFSESQFHVVLAINLIDRLPSPQKFLAQLPDLVAQGGQLVLASPFTWMEEYTPRREWIDSRSLPSLLRPHFGLVRRRDLPFLIREHRRKYQWCVSEVSTYVRTG